MFPFPKRYWLLAVPAFAVGVLWPLLTIHGLPREAPTIRTLTHGYFDGGVFMHGILILAVLQVAVTMGWLKRASRGDPPLFPLLVLPAVTLAIGLLAAYLGLREGHEAIATAPGDMKVLMWTAVLAFVDIPWQFAMLVAGGGSLVALTGAVLVSRRRDPDPLPLSGVGPWLAGALIAAGGVVAAGFLGPGRDLGLIAWQALTVFGIGGLAAAAVQRSPEIVDGGTEDEPWHVPPAITGLGVFAALTAGGGTMWAARQASQIAVIARFIDLRHETGPEGSGGFGAAAAELAGLHTAQLVGVVGLCLAGLLWLAAGAKSLERQGALGIGERIVLGSMVTVVAAVLGAGFLLERAKIQDTETWRETLLIDLPASVELSPTTRFGDRPLVPPAVILDEGAVVFDGQRLGRLDDGVNRWAHTVIARAKDEAGWGRGSRERVLPPAIYGLLCDQRVRVAPAILADGRTPWSTVTSALRALSRADGCQVRFGMGTPPTEPTAKLRLTALLTELRVLNHGGPRETPELFLIPQTLGVGLDGLLTVGPDDMTLSAPDAPTKEVVRLNDPSALPGAVEAFMPSPPSPRHHALGVAFHPELTQQDVTRILDHLKGPGSRTWLQPVSEVALVIGERP